MAKYTQAQIDHLRQLRASGATSVTIDGHTINLRSQKELDQLLSEAEMDDLTARVTNTARPDFMIDTFTDRGV